MGDFLSSFIFREFHPSVQCILAKSTLHSLHSNPPSQATNIPFGFHVFLKKIRSPSTVLILEYIITLLSTQQSNTLYFLAIL